jgi:hypothetical protein
LRETIKYGGSSLYKIFYSLPGSKISYKAYIKSFSIQTQFFPAIPLFKGSEKGGICPIRNHIYFLSWNFIIVLKLCFYSGGHSDYSVRKFKSFLKDK